MPGHMGHSGHKHKSKMKKKKKNTLKGKGPMPGGGRNVRMTGKPLTASAAAFLMNNQNKF